MKKYKGSTFFVSTFDDEARIRVAFLAKKNKRMKKGMLRDTQKFELLQNGDQ